MITQEESREEYVRNLLRNMSTEEFMNLGVSQVAYIRPVTNSDGAFYAVCAADGRPLSMMNSFEEAIRSTISNKLEPVTVH